MVNTRTHTDRLRQLLTCHSISSTSRSGRPHLLYTRDVVSARYKVHDVHAIVHGQFCVDELDAGMYTVICTNCLQIGWQFNTSPHAALDADFRSNFSDRCQCQGPIFSDGRQPACAIANGGSDVVLSYWWHTPKGFKTPKRNFHNTIRRCF